MGKHTGKAAFLAAVSILVWPTIAASQQGGLGVPATGPQYGGTAAQPTVPSPATPSTSSTGPQPGLQIDIGVKTTAKRDDNFALTPGGGAGTTGISDTNLSFGLSSVTQAYTLTVNASGVLRYAHIPGRTLKGLEDPIFDILYIADSANSRLTLTGHYRRVERLFLNPFQVLREDLANNLITNGGILRDPSYSLKYETGLNDPLGFVLTAKHAEKNFSQVINPRIFDTTTDTATAQANLRFNQVTTGRITAGYTHYTAKDLVLTDRRTIDYAVGITRDLTQTLQLDAQIGHTEVKTDTIGGLARRDGLTGAVTLVQTVANGTVTGSFSATTNQNGQRTTLSFGRNLALPNGSLNAMIGTTKGSVGHQSIIGSLAYSLQLASDTFTVNLDRSVGTNNVNQEILDTTFGLSWGHAIDAVSNVNLGLNWAESDDVGPTNAPTIRLTDLTATYSRQMTADWTMTGGMTYRTRTETGKLDAHSTAVFLTLGRNFSFRP